MNATVACVVVALALVGATARMSASVFIAVAAVATAVLSASDALPIALGAVARAEGRWTRRGSWSFRRGRVVLAWSAVAWTAWVEIVCALANGLALAIFVGLAMGAHSLVDRLGAEALRGAQGGLRALRTSIVD